MPDSLSGKTWFSRITAATSVQLAIIAVLVALLYGRTMGKLISDWYVLPDFSHGFLVPFFVAYLIWERRDVLWNVDINQTWKGMALFSFGLILLMLGTFGAEIFLSRVSLVVLLAGVVWTLLGAHILRALKFPLGILLLAIPLPAVIFNQITFPLQLLASRTASLLLPLFGVPVLREGNVIQLPSIQLEVAEACSGIRSLLSLLTIAILYGYFLERSTGKRILLALASVPIAVVANSLRIVGTGLCVQYWNPDKAIGFFHEFSGWLMFVLSLGCLYCVHRMMDVFSQGSEVSR
ncbi:exosortase [Terriglobus albidus]|uniref:Exosortase n=2 Tax=Terriglobus albidus TaxID=1592106 RepID=A0A5B9EI32_9BACT|nr:exosortase [Terriglobus albidus]